MEEAGADAVWWATRWPWWSLGHATTLPVTLEEMVMHTRAVGRGLAAPHANQQPLIIT